MSSTTQVIVVCVLLCFESISSTHLKKKFGIVVEHEVEKVKEPEKPEEVKEEKKPETNAIPKEPPEKPAPVVEILLDDININPGLPFFKPEQELIKIPVEREVIEIPKLNTDVVGSIITVETEVTKESEQRELPRRQSETINSLSEVLITPRPVPAGPLPTPTIIPPEIKPPVLQLTEGVSPVPSESVPLLVPLSAYVPRFTIAPRLAAIPFATIEAEVSVPPPPAPPTSPKPPVPPPAPEYPLFKPRRYVTYLGDMFLKLMTQFLGRARLTFNRITSPPPTSPELENNGK